MNIEPIQATQYYQWLQLTGQPAGLGEPTWQIVGIVRQSIESQPKSYILLLGSPHHFEIIQETMTLLKVKGPRGDVLYKKGDQLVFPLN